MRRLPRYLVFGGALALAAACSNAGSERVLSITATGTVSGFVYFDADGSATLSPGDDSLANVRVNLVPSGDTTRVVETTLTRPSGFYKFSGVPVGAYAIRVDTTTIGDTVRVVRVDSATVTVLPAESAVVSVGVGFPSVSVAAARLLPAGRRVFLTGVVLNRSSTFEDSVVHLVDTSAAIRMTRLRASVGEGDSVRVRGTTARRDGLPTFDDVRVVPLGTGLTPVLVRALLQSGAPRHSGMGAARFSRHERSPADHVQGHAAVRGG